MFANASRPGLETGNPGPLSRGKLSIHLCLLQRFLTMRL